MKEKLLTLILLLISLPSIFLNIHLFSKIQEEMRVVEVVDGDTFQLKSGKRVRLLGVDAPEYNLSRTLPSQARKSQDEIGTIQA